MALITRVSRLFQADVHAVLDRIEEPISLLRQAVREMEEELDQDSKQHRLLVHEFEQLEKQLVVVDQSLQQLETELDICFEHHKDDLARGLIRKKLETQLVQKSLLHQSERLQQTTANAGKRIEQNQSRLESMRQKAELLDDRCWARDRDDSFHFSTQEIGEEDIEVAFLHEQQQRSMR